MELDPQWTPKGPLIPVEVSDIAKKAEHFSALSQRVIWWERAVLRAPAAATCLVRLASYESILEDNASAEEHYDQAQAIVGTGTDPVFDKWLVGWKQWWHRAIREDLEDDQSQTPTVPWRPLLRLSSFATDHHASFRDVRVRWDRLCHLQGDSLALERYFRLLNIESAELEHVFKLEGDSLPRLVRVGFWEAAIAGLTKLPHLSHDPHVVVDILKSAEEAVNALGPVFGSRAQITVDLVHRLHALTLRHCRFNVTYSDGVQYPYAVRTGHFRVLASSTTVAGSGGYVQFAPASAIQDEMTGFLSGWSEILDAVNGASDSEVFAGASWIHSAFAAIHPYTDGNGRLARLLGSVPLVRAGLPPLLIPAAHRSEYLAACSIAQRDRDLRPMVHELIRGAHWAIDFLEGLAPVGPEDHRFRDDGRAGHTRPPKTLRGR